MYIYFNYSQMQKFYFLYAIYFLYNAVKNTELQKVHGKYFFKLSTQSNS